MFAVPEEVALSIALAVPLVTGTTMTLELFDQVPSVVTKVTLVVGDGATTLTRTLVPIVAPLRVASVEGVVIWKAAAAPETRRLVVRVSPTPVTVSTSGVPDALGEVGVSVVIKVPAASVTPVVGASVTAPLPDWVMAIAWPDKVVPAEFFATTVRVAFAPPMASELLLVVTVNDEPVTRTGMTAVLALAFAVMVAVRVVAFAPAENVTVALPVASLVALGALRNPLSTAKLTGTPETAALLASATVAVIVLELLLSEATAVIDALMLSDAATGATTTGVIGVVVDEEPDPPPPQAASNNAHATADRTAIERDEMIFNMNSQTTKGWRTARRHTEPRH